MGSQLPFRLTTTYSLIQLIDTPRDFYGLNLTLRVVVKEVNFSRSGRISEISETRARFQKSPIPSRAGADPELETSFVRLAFSSVNFIHDTCTCITAGNSNWHNWLSRNPGYQWIKLDTLWNEDIRGWWWRWWWITSLPSFVFVLINSPPPSKNFEHGQKWIKWWIINHHSYQPVSRAA